jgi:hypothetical protein
LPNSFFWSSALRPGRGDRSVTGCFNSCR